MTQPAADWIQYWDSQSEMSDAAWRKNTELFLNGSRSFFEFTPDDTVLDIGSGPGFLAEALRNRVQAVHCVDTSARYVAEGRRRLSGAGNVIFTQLGADYLDFSFLGKERFSKIVCASVIQYYRDAGEVRKLISAVRDHARPGALMLIADIPQGGTLFQDLVALIRTSWRNHYLIRAVLFTMRSLWGDYHRLRKSKGLLHLRKDELERIVGDLGLRGEWLTAPLTLNDRRQHLLIHM